MQAFDTLATRLRAAVLAGMAVGLPAAAVAAPAGPLPDVAAHFRLQLEPAEGGMPAPAPKDWYFQRSASELRIAKGDIEEVWRRDARGQISFERIFHADQRRVFYTPGELRTLGIEAEWERLGQMVDRPAPGEPAQLQWDDQRQLPLLLSRGLAAGKLTLRLVDTWGVAPAGWAARRSASEGYLLVDAADLGDMPNDSFAGKAEAYDLRVGWRAPHAH